MQDQPNAQGGRHRPAGRRGREDMTERPAVLSRGSGSEIRLVLLLLGASILLIALALRFLG